MLNHLCGILPFEWKRRWFPTTSALMQWFLLNVALNYWMGSSKEKTFIEIKILRNLRLLCSSNYMVVFDPSKHDSHVIVLGTNYRMNESTDNQILPANSPVVFSGVVSLRGLTTSIWLESLIVVSGVACSTSVWSKWRISFGSWDDDTSDSTILPGSSNDLSSLSKETERKGLFHWFR